MNLIKAYKEDYTFFQFKMNTKNNKYVKKDITKADYYKLVKTLELLISKNGACYQYEGIRK